MPTTEFASILESIQEACFLVGDISEVSPEDVENAVLLALTEEAMHEGAVR
jgi:hypothetical protein